MERDREGGASSRGGGVSEHLAADTKSETPCTHPARPELVPSYLLLNFLQTHTVKPPGDDSPGSLEPGENCSVRRPGWAGCPAPYLLSAAPAPTPTAGGARVVWSGVR